MSEAPGRPDPLARLEALIGTLEREERQSARELAESERSRAEAAREGRMGPEWQAVQRRVDAGETTVLDVFSGRDESPEAHRLRELSRANLQALRDTMPTALVEEVEDSDEAFDRMRERVARAPRRADAQSPDADEVDDA
jgi:hypothetical protein